MLYDREEEEEEDLSKDGSGWGEDGSG